MLHRKPWLVAIVVLAMIMSSLSFTGCSLLPTKSQEDTKQAYTVAIVAFADLSEDYANAYDLADPATQAKWKAEVDPRVLQAREALRLWKRSMDAGGGEEAKEAYDAILTDLVMLLVEVGVVQIE